MRSLAGIIDHTLLAPEATSADVRRVAGEVLQYGFRGLCIGPCWVPLGRELLAGSPARLVSVTGFPLGTDTTSTKAFQTRELVSAGADEIDMVLALGAFREGLDAIAADDIRAVVDAAEGRPVKVIVETCVLTEDEKRRACHLVRESGAAFLKTSTGFHRAGADPADVRLFRAELGDSLKIKASAGIRTLAAARALVDAGAEVLGCSASVAIVKEERSGSRQSAVE